ncbi:glycosyl transferase [Halosimplex salinum]|uniref:glycosyl transferase n=1 Tax=Halosimplex salinum TaxID=1710538 RepID=UPI000F49D078|nr:glycosyl transferase [Halosimplex salinum]
MPFGPRLDRPSAVGDEGRARETSLGVAAVTVVGLALATAVLTGRASVLGGIALVVGTTAAGVAMLDRDGLGQKVVGHLCFLPGAVLLGVLVATVPGDRSPLAAGFALAFLGIASAWADVADAAVVESALAQGVLSYVFGLVWALGGGVVVGALYLCWTLATLVLDAQTPSATAVGLLAAFAVVLGVVRLVLPALPVVQLTPRDRRRPVRARLGRAKRALSLSAAVAAGTAVLSLAVLATPSLSLRQVPGVVAAVDALSSASVLGALLAVGGLALLVTVVAAGVRQTTRQFDETRTRTAAAGIAGGGYVAVLCLAVVPEANESALFDSVLVVGGVLVAPLVVFVVFGAALVALRAGLVPEGAGGPALAAAGLVVTGIGADSVGLPAPLVFGCVAGALAVWDVGSFGLGVTAELGHRPETRRIELTHAVFAVGIGVVTVLGATALLAARATTSGIGHTAAMTAAVIGALLLGALIRG